MLFPMKSLIIPDIHDEVAIVDSIVERERPDEAIFLGDYFDSFNGSPADALNTARWLKARLWLPGYFFIMGNHETQYRWPKSPWHISKSYTKNKQDAIDSVLTTADWQRMTFAVQRGNYWFSHAGFHPDLFARPNGWNDNRVWEIIHRAEFEASAGIHTYITDEQRDTSDAPSGPQWLRWQQFVPIPGVNQVVGHTEHDVPQEKNMPDSRNVNLDTHLCFYGVLEDGAFSVRKVAA